MSGFLGETLSNLSGSGYFKRIRKNQDFLESVGPAGIKVPPVNDHRFFPTWGATLSYFGIITENCAQDEAAALPNKPIRPIH